MIQLGFNGTDRRVTLALQARGPQLVTALTKTLSELMLELQARIQRKLSGEVLKSRRGGGGLLGSVRLTPVHAGAARIQGGVQAGGGLFWWAIVHERGGRKVYWIYPGAVTGKSDKKALAFIAPGAIGVGGQGRAGATRLRFALGKRRGELRPGRLAEFRAAGGIVVKQVKHPPLPRRSFMQASLDEMRTEITQRVFAAAAKALG